MNAVINIVVLHIACQVALQAVAVYIAAEAYIEHTSVNPYGIGFCHRANFSPGIVLSKA